MTAPDEAPALAAVVAAEFRRRLLGEQLPRIRRCVGLLGDERLWQRPAPNCNSVGNLLLHLCGNTAQWILGPLSGRPDDRRRELEFATSEGLSGELLLDRLAAVYAAACDAVDRAAVADLLRPVRIQGYEETGLSAVLHVLEHSSGHAGQIYAWTKQVTGLDLRFYEL